MKRKRILWVAVAAMVLTACEKASLDDRDDGNVTLKFTASMADVTRATVSIGDYFSTLNVMLFDAEGQKVFDKVKTQTVGDAAFGQMSVSLAKGMYTVVAVGHSSPVTPSIKSAELVQFTAKDGVKNSDTFCYCGSVTIDQNGSRHELQMNRMTAMLRFRLTDSTQPKTFSQLRIDYTGGSANFNPTTSQGCTKSSQSELRQAPSSEYQCFTFPYLADEGLLNVTLVALDDNGTVIRQRTISNVPVTRNRITTYTGPFFEPGDGQIVQSSFGLTVNGDWDGEDEYTF